MMLFLVYTHVNICVYRYIIILYHYMIKMYYCLKRLLVCICNMREMRGFLIVCPQPLQGIALFDSKRFPLLNSISCLEEEKFQC